MFPWIDDSFIKILKNFNKNYKLLRTKSIEKTW